MNRPADLRAEIEALPLALRERLAARGFEAETLVRLAADVGLDKDARNRLKGEVTPPLDGEISDAPARGSAEEARLAELGEAALAGGKVALCVLAGGMATRMGGVVKALVEALPGRTFLDLRLAQAELVQARARRRSPGARLPVWLMTSEATEGPTRAALEARGAAVEVATFEQCVSLRLTPEGELFRDADGDPSVYATGHGDLPDALRKSGLLRSFVDRGGEWVLIANLDNLGATVDPALVGWQIEAGSDLSVEVVDKVGTDRGGVPVRCDGRRIVAEEFRLPKALDPATIRVFNTNTFWVRARALLELELAWTYVEVEKTIDGRRAVQFERLLGETTMALEPRLLRVPRSGVASRFLPVKDVAELEARKPELEAVVAARFTDAAAAPREGA